MKGGERVTFLEEAAKKGALLPSPSQYSPTKHLKISKVKFEKAERSSFLDDIVYNADKVPGSYNPKKDVVLKKVLSAKILPPGKHDQKKGWRTEQNDSPNPQSYKELDRATRLIKQSSPSIAFSKSKRNLFTDDFIKIRNISPSPDKYNSIDESKIVKVMAKPRRY